MIEIKQTFGELRDTAGHFLIVNKTATRYPFIRRLKLNRDGKFYEERLLIDGLYSTIQKVLIPDHWMVVAHINVQEGAQDWMPIEVVDEVVEDEL